MTTEEYIQLHKDDNIRKLALTTGKEIGIDASFALDQIAGRQKARTKLPAWAATDGIVYPPAISMEQCSGETAAEYKTSVLKRLTDKETSKCILTDLTGGFGVDFSYMARTTSKAVYVEQQQHLCDIVAKNLNLLGIINSSVICANSVDYLNDMSPVTCIYIDPARRDTNGAKVYGIEDCSPDILKIKEQLMTKSRFVMIKLSPMLDVDAAIKVLGQDNIKEVHIVSVRNECKEILIVMQCDAPADITVYCVNDNDIFTYIYGNGSDNGSIIFSDNIPLRGYLYEPNASIMKAGCFALLAERYGMKEIERNSHLFVSEQNIKSFPGRAFIINDVMTMNKKELRHKLDGITKANVAVRNFPMKAEELKKRLKLTDGGSVYLFGTTTKKGKHIIIRASKVN